MLIHWIVGGVSVDATGAPLASLATNRYRAILPAMGLGERGHSVKLFHMQHWVAPAFEEMGKDQPDIVVIGKLLIKKKDAERGTKLGNAIIAKIIRMRGNGIKVFADVNDNHFDDKTSGTYWRSLVAAVDGVVVGSPAMAQIVEKHSDRPIFVVGDPLGAPHGEPLVFRRNTNWAGRLLGPFLPRHLVRQRLVLVWYGNTPNWPSLKAWAEQLARLGKEQPLTIRLVSMPGAGIEDFSVDFNARFSPVAQMEFITWDEKTVWDIVAESHIVLIPSDLEDSRKSVKTANRLTDALYCGRFVVASPVPSYAAYEDCAWLGENLVDGIRWAIEHPDEALERVRRGQEKVAERCSIEAIAANWENAFMSLQPNMSTPTSMQAEPRPVQTLPVSPAGNENAPPVRLNLGCGDKLLEGYVNVDVAPSRRGLRPDVLCDLHDLSVFAGDSADEVLAVHVVEHFWRWEVLGILKEWVRVLKPGGRMILECPNLISACEVLLNDPENASEGDARGQRSMWVFYGDPSWQDPLMTHRWAYTPKSLASLMSEAGLVDVHQEPAQFKLREPRDMRIVGTKPS